MRTGTITSVSIIGGAALGAALIGVLGAYVVLPEVAPSVATTDSSSAQVASVSDSTAGQAPTAELGAPKMDSMQTDSAAGQQEETREGTSAPRDTTADMQIQALRDSIDTLNGRLAETKETTDTLRSKLADADAEQAKVNELSDALMEMRQRNLGNLLKDVDMSVLKTLYRETSGQARTRLLQSMAPGKAAQFVNQVVEGGAKSSSRSDADS